MLSELLEQDRGEQMRAGKAARRHVEGCRRLRDRLAVAAREALAHGLDHFQRRGITSSVSVISSPSFDSRADPQQGQRSGAARTTRSRGRCAGNGRREGRSAQTISPPPLKPVGLPVRPRSPQPRAPPARAPSGRGAAPGAPSGCRRAVAAASRSRASDAQSTLRCWSGPPGRWPPRRGPRRSSACAAMRAARSAMIIAWALARSAGSGSAAAVTDRSNQSTVACKPDPQPTEVGQVCWG